MTAQQETMAERMARVRAFRKAETNEVDNTPVENTVARGPRTMTSAEVFAAQTVAGTVTPFGFKGEDGEASGMHTRPGMVMMWKPGSTGQYVPRLVPDGNRGPNLRNGWLPACPDCGTNHEQSPYPPSDPNSCPAREPVAVRICPVCHKRIPDNMGWETRAASNIEAPDAGSILTDEEMTSTPESRTRMQLNIHLWERHPRQAQTMNIPPIPQGFANPSLPPQVTT